MPEPDSGVPASPADNGGAPIAPAQTTEPNGSEPVTNSGDGNQEQPVPFSRFQEVNNKAKTAEEDARKVREELEALKQQQSQSTQSLDEDDDIDPSVRSLVTKIIEKGGYVKKDDVQSAVQAADLKRQYSEDVVSLTNQYANSGIPFKVENVRQYAKDNGINITSKASMDATYKAMNSDKIIEAAKNAAITEFKEGGRTSAEKPGSTGASQPAEPEVRGIKNRIHAARQRQTS